MDISFIGMRMVKNRWIVITGKISSRVPFVNGIHQDSLNLIRILAVDFLMENLPPGERMAA